jgi:cytoskeletal protein RodZ
MTNNPESVKRLKEYSQQMGFDPLDLSDAIDTHAETIHGDILDDEIFDAEDLEGTTDLQSRAKNPVLQYAAAAVIGTLVLGVPLSTFFSLGGGKSVAKTDAPDKPQQTATTNADPEVEKLKTNTALDIQNPTANVDTTAKPTPPQNPSESQVGKQQETPATTKTPPVATTSPVTKTPTVAHLPTPVVKPVVVAQAPQVTPTLRTISQPAYRIASSPYPKVASVPIPRLPIKVKEKPVIIAAAPKPYYNPALFRPDEIRQPQPKPKTVIIAAAPKPQPNQAAIIPHSAS